MIEFRRAPRPEPPRRFLARFRAEAEGLPADAFGQLADWLLAQRHRSEEILHELCTWEDAPLRRFLEGCRASGVHEAQGLAEAVLIRRGCGGLVDWLEGLLEEEHAARWLVDLLGEIRDDVATRLLLRLLDHPSQSIRRRAADGLAGHRAQLDTRAFIRHLAEPLVRQSEHPDPLHAVRALQRIADPSLEPAFGRDAARRAERVLINCVRHERRGMVRGDAIAAVGEVGSRAAVRCLVDMLNRDEQRYHREVVVALRKIRPERALLALLGLLQSRDPVIREEAAAALGEIGDRQAARRLRELLDDASADVRQEAVLALGKLGGREVLEALERALSDSDPAVRTAACSALADGLGRSAQGKLIGALYDDSADVRGEAAFHLGNIGDDDARSHLEGRLKDRARDAFGDSVASIARRSLWRLRLALQRGA